MIRTAVIGARDAAAKKNAPIPSRPDVRGLTRRNGGANREHGVSIGGAEHGSA